MLNLNTTLNLTQNRQQYAILPISNIYHPEHRWLPHHGWATHHTVWGEWTASHTEFIILPNLLALGWTVWMGR